MMGPSDSHNAADAREVRQAEDLAAARAVEAVEDLRVVMSTRPGRRLVRRWLARHGLYETITRADVLIYALSGRRDAGLEMLNEAVALDELYLFMEAEAREDARLEQRILEAARVLRRGVDEADDTPTYQELN